MRPIVRLDLLGTSEAFLARRQADVDASDDPAERAAELWALRRNRTFEDVTSKLQAMAKGRSRCMYCEDNMATDIEHFWPKSVYPQKAFNWTNYLWACSYCNSNLKRTQFPLADGVPLLIDPSMDDPASHLNLLPTSGEFDALTAKGAESIRVFGLNDRSLPRKLPQGRRGVWLAAQTLLRRYDEVHLRDAALADEIKLHLLEQPFSAVWLWLVKYGMNPDTVPLLMDGVPDIITRHEVHRW